MINLVARLSRVLPLIIVLVILAIVLYFVIAYVKTPTRAKEILIKVFTVVCTIISVVFALGSIYAWVDNNMPVFELALSCFIIGIVGLAVTLICKFIFVKNHPHYRYRPNATAQTQQGGISRSTIFWKIYDLLGNFRPNKK